MSPQVFSIQCEGKLFSQFSVFTLSSLTIAIMPVTARVERHTHGSSLSSCRLYSDYLYFGIANKSAEDFHEKVSESLQLFEGCLTEYTMRSCVYNTTVNNAMPVSAHTHTHPPLLSVGRESKKGVS